MHANVWQHLCQQSLHVAILISARCAGWAAELDGDYIEWPTGDWHLRTEQEDITGIAGAIAAASHAADVQLPNILRRCSKSVMSRAASRYGLACNSASDNGRLA